PVVTGDPGPPALTGALLLFTSNRGTRIYALDLATNVLTLLRQAWAAQLRGPSSDGLELAYVYATYRRQQVRVGPLAPAPPAGDAAAGRSPANGRHRRGAAAAALTASPRAPAAARGRGRPPHQPRRAPRGRTSRWSRRPPARGRRARRRCRAACRR